MEAYKKTIFCVIAICLVAYAEAGVNRFCKLPTGEQYGLGESYFTNGYDGCMKVTCDGENSYSALTCPPFQIAPGSLCFVKPGVKSATYPGCCESPVCVNSNEISLDASKVSEEPALYPYKSASYFL